MHNDEDEDLRKVAEWFRGMYINLRNLIGRIATAGWRPVFCWVGGLITLKAMYVFFVELPLAGAVVTEVQYNSFQILLGTMVLVLGLRGAEKAFGRHQNINATGSAVGGNMNNWDNAGAVR